MKVSEILEKSNNIAKSIEEFENFVSPLYSRMKKKLFEVENRRDIYYLSIDYEEVTYQDSIKFQYQDSYSGDYDGYVFLPFFEVEMSDEDFEQYLINLKKEKQSDEEKSLRKRLKDELSNLRTQIKLKEKKVKELEIKVNDR